MSKPMKIDDRAFFAGSGSPTFPKNNAVKEYESASGSGGKELDYEDTSAEIKSQQEKGIAKVKAHPMKPNYRN